MRVSAAPLTTVAIVLAVVLSGCFGGGRLPFEEACVPQGGGVADGAPVCFTTADGWILEGTLWKGGDKGAPTILMVHGLNEEHGAYGKLAADLAARGFTVLAFDSRGHGESRLAEGAQPRWPEFTDREYQGLYRDVAAASDYLVDNDLRRATALVGSLLGANEALQYAASEQALGLEAVVLLSPGVTYRGMTSSLAFARDWEGHTLVAVSEDDEAGMRDAHSILGAMTGEEETLKTWPSKGRGTKMLDDLAVRGAVVAWIGNATLSIPTPMPS